MIHSWLITVLLSAHAPAANPCGGAEYRQFDFWLGDWEVTTPNGKKAGNNKIESILGGCVLQESWVSAGGPVRGHSFNLYDATTKRWHQTWVDNGGSLLVLDGGLKDDAMVLIDARSENRITWSKKPEGRVRQLWEVSKDGGKTWTVSFDGLYAKKN